MTDIYRISRDIERAIADFKGGRPVIIEAKTGDESCHAIMSVENITPESLQKIREMTDDLYIIISSKRGEAIFRKKFNTATLRISIPHNHDIKYINDISGLGKEIDTSDIDIYPDSGYDEKLLKLPKLSERLPAILCGNISKEIDDITSVDILDIEKYEEISAKSLKKIVTAPLTLELAKDASITLFRSLYGNIEHYAVIVGSPSTNPLVRIHSSCFTGDLLGSLTCDCGEQLKDSMRFMEKNGGGIILYLMQEGRGIGLANKLRTYALQCNKGMDTVEANEFLGFNDDERPYLPAVTMLKEMDINEIRLITNNPRKVAGVEEYGIKVSERVPLIIDSHEHNETYMKTKSTKLGHHLDI